MQRVLLVNTAAAVACVALLGGAVPRAGAAIAYGPCPKTNQYACAHLAVPLDPGGVTAGTVTLSIRRHRAAVGDGSTAIVALAGGPGQPAIPFAEEFALLMGPIADTRDLIVFDQRGTGSSQALSCHLHRPHRHLTLQQTVSRCAAALGPRRAFYTTADTVADIEAIREAGGYEKLVLYGTSYGTKVAEEYAQAHPDRVEALILDSVVAPNGPDVLNRPTFGALSRVLRQVCARGACRDVTLNPVADLTRVLRRIHRGPLRARAVDAQGHSRKSRITAQELLGTLLLGDFSASLRAEFVTDVRAAALGDDSPLARTLQTLSGTEGAGEGEEIDGPLYYATTCEEQSFPWNRAALPAHRLREAEAAARVLPASTFAPFTAADALTLSDIPACSAWPYPPTRLPSDTAPLPAVPTLILSGADDLRTPTSGARALARLIPGAHLLVVPLTGHSVLGSDPSSCSGDALQALFKGRPIKPCHSAAPPARLRPQAPPPRTLGAVAPQPGYHGLAGRTAHGVALTIADLARQLGLQIELGGAGLGAFGTSAVRTGGLHSGWARLTSSAVELHDYSLVPGLTLSGTIRPEVLKLRVGGSAASHGSLRRGSRHMLVGTLGGQPVRLPASSEISAAIVGIDASTHAEIQHRRPRDARPGVPGPRLGDGGPQLHPLR